MTDVYADREQTRAKHFILKRYLQALAFKVLNFSDITYVDGFSGPWETKAGDFSDSSFMIAISALRGAQKLHFKRTGHNARIRCFFSEKNAAAFSQLDAAVAPFNKPGDHFEIKTYHGDFEDAIEVIDKFIGNSFPLVFIDPTGWTGFSLDKIKALFIRPKCEVVINFMYDHVNRFANSGDETIVASLNPILGGPGWRDRLDPNLRRGPAVEKLFRETLKAAGQFDFVISTRIDKATVERPHFFLAYGTKSHHGLKAFRETENKALREHAKNRATAKEKRREDSTGTSDLFPSYLSEAQEQSIDDIVAEQIDAANNDLTETLRRCGHMDFSAVVAKLLQAYVIRETNVKDICVDLARAGKIANTWGTVNRKPSDGCSIRLPNASDVRAT